MQLSRNRAIFLTKTEQQIMGCWQKPAEIWTDTVHDPMNLLDNAIVGSVLQIVQRKRPA